MSGGTSWERNGFILKSWWERLLYLQCVSWRGIIKYRINNRQPCYWALIPLRGSVFQKRVRCSWKLSVWGHWGPKRSFNPQLGCGIGKKRQALPYCPHLQCLDLCCSQSIQREYRGRSSWWNRVWCNLSKTSSERAGTSTCRGNMYRSISWGPKTGLIAQCSQPSWSCTDGCAQLSTADRHWTAGTINPVGGSL